MKKIVSLLLALCLVATTCVGSFSPALSVQASDEEVWKDWTLTQSTPLDHSVLEEGRAENSLPIMKSDPDEWVNVIIELSGETLLDRYNTDFAMAQQGELADYLASAQMTAISDEMISTQERVKAKIMEIDATITLDNNFTIVVNAFSGRVRQGDLAQIEQIPQVKQVYLDRLYEVPVTEHGDQSSLDMINMPAVWNQSGYLGEGTIVSIIDTGVDYTHPLFADTDINEPALSKSDVSAIVSSNGLAANSLARLANAYKSTKVPYYYNYSQDYAFNQNTAESDNMPDSGGHGTHVAGIAAGGDASFYDADDSRLAGVAPEAQVLAMRVFPNAYDSIIIKAIQDSLTLGATGVNMSLGTTAGFTDEGGAFSYKEIFKSMGEAGILVAVSAGNEDRVGSDGSVFGVSMPYASNPDWGLAGSPSTESAVISIASAENTQNYTIPLTITAGGESFRISYNDTNSTYHVSGKTFSELLGDSTFAYVFCGLGYPEDFVGLDLTGKLALILRGELSFSDKVANATAAGATGVIVYSNSTGTGGMDLSGLSQTEYAPAVIISQADGLRIMDLPEEVPVEIYVETQTAWADNPSYQADKMSSFTSWGPTPDLKLKPELTAPGGNIYSSVPGGKYELMSGTSMSAPHVAGAMAVLSQYINDSDLFSSFTLPNQSVLKSQLLLSTAEPIINWDGSYVSPRRQGAGMMDVNAAVNTEVVLYNDYDNKAKYELGDQLDEQYGFLFYMENHGATDRTYALTATAQTDMPVLGEELDESLRGLIYNSGEPLVFEDVAVTVNGQDIETARITVPAGERVAVQIDFDLGQESQLAWADACYVNGFYLEGFVRLRDVKDETPTLGLPYLGFYGDWLDAPFMDLGNVAELLEYTNGIQELDENVPFFPLENAYPNGLISATTEGYAFPLGTNYYAEDGMPAGTEYIAYPTTNNALISNLYVTMNLLRNVRSASSEIEDENGQQIWYNQYCETNVIGKMEYLRKTYFSSSYNYYANSPLIVPWNGLSYGTHIAEDGWYTYRIHAVSDYHDRAFHEPWETRFYVDGTAPAVDQSFVVNENGQWYWYVSVEEDHYLALAEAYYDYGGGLQYSVAALIPDYRISDMGQGETVYLRFDITPLRTHLVTNGSQFDMSSLGLYMIDYATNVTDFSNDTAFHGITTEKETYFLHLQDGNDVQIPLLPRQTGDVIPATATYTTEMATPGIVRATVQDDVLLLTAQAPGTTTVTVRMVAPDGSVHTVQVTAMVTEMPLTLNLNRTTHQFDLVNATEVLSLTASFTPIVSYDNLIFTCDNNAVVHMVQDPNGMGVKVTPLAMGTATITVAAADNPDLQATCRITVINSYATPIYTLTFNLAGGKVNGYSDDIIVSVSDDTVGAKMPPNPYFTGYTFQGWFMENGTQFTATTPITGNMTLTAKWEVVSSGNGGTGSNSPGSSGTTTTTPTPAPTENAPTGTDTASSNVPTGQFGNLTLYTASDYKYVPLHADGSYSPNNTATRADLAVMLYNLVKEEDKVAVQISFRDVAETASYAQAIAYLADKGVFTGYPDGTFCPDQTMTRAEFVTALSRLGTLETTKVDFRDLTAKHWAFANISNAVARGWVNGYTDGTFRPNQSVTHAESVKIINLLLGRTPQPIEHAPVIPGLATDFWGYEQIISALIVE